MIDSPLPSRRRDVRRRPPGGRPPRAGRRHRTRAGHPRGRKPERGGAGGACRAALAGLPRSRSASILIRRISSPTIPIVRRQSCGEQFAATATARAMGEIGLDYHYDYSPRDVQQAVFRSQLRRRPRARSSGRHPHARGGRRHDRDPSRRGAGPAAGRPALFHRHRFPAGCGLALGFYISLAGILTFPKAADLRETARGVPLDRLLTETDSPFLAPVPYRGKRNEPAYVARVVEALAEMHQTPPESSPGARLRISTPCSGRDKVLH